MEAPNLPVESAQVIASIDGSDDSYSSTTDNNGVFIIDNIPKFNTVTITVTDNDYQTAIIENISTSSGSDEISLSLIPIVTNNETNLVRFQGKVFDSASDSTTIDDVTVKARSGLNNQNGDIIDNSVSSSDGTFTLPDIATGNYTLELVKDGFYTSFENIYVDSVNEDEIVKLYLHTDINPTQTENEPVVEPITSLVITLLWDAQPEDLDAYLTGPISGESLRFVIKFTELCWADTNLDTTASCDDNETATAYLERDDVDGFGPETLVVKQLTEGTYKFYVHHSDLLLTTDEGSISTTSNAQVTVVDSNGQTYKFYAPVSGGEGVDDIWHVFSTDANGVPRLVNTLEANDSDVTGSLD